MAELRYKVGTHIRYRNIATKTDRRTVLEQHGIVREDCETFYWVDTLGRLHAIDDADILGVVE